MPRLITCPTSLSWTLVTSLGGSRLSMYSTLLIPPRFRLLSQNDPLHTLRARPAPIWRPHTSLTTFTTTFSSLGPQNWPLSYPSVTRCPSRVPALPPVKIRLTLHRATLAFVTTSTFGLGHQYPATGEGWFCSRASLFFAQIFLSFVFVYPGNIFPFLGGKDSCFIEHVRLVPYQRD